MKMLCRKEHLMLTEIFVISAGLNKLVWWENFLKIASDHPNLYGNGEFKGDSIF